jgi:hypothetical protein
MEFTQIPQRDKARDLGVADLRGSTIDVVYEVAAPTDRCSTPSVHTLGRVPAGFTVIFASMNVAGTAAISVSATAEDKNKWTDTRIYTRASETGTAKLEVR